MNTTITTIIPFYNCGNLLSKMLDSILAGSMLPYEILLIDDGSTDSSPEIAKSYSDKCSFVKYIKQPHSGVSAARNLGIKNATGEWISFFDADDYIENSMYEQMINAITDDSFAGCVCGYYTLKDNVSTAYQAGFPRTIDSKTLLKAMFTDDNVRGFLFTRLFKTSLIKDLTFNTDISMCEDLLFQTTLLSKNPNLKFAYVNSPLYFYVQNSSSATSSPVFFKDGVFKYEPAFSLIRGLVDEPYINDSYNSILEYSMYCLLKDYKEHGKQAVPQIRMMQKELKKSNPSKISKRRTAYTHAPLLYSLFMK